MAVQDSVWFCEIWGAGGLVMDLVDLVVLVVLVDLVDPVNGFIRNRQGQPGPSKANLGQARPTRANPFRILLWCFSSP